MASIETFPWDVTDHLQTDAEQVAFLEAAMEGVAREGGPEFVALALVAIARARGILGPLEEALRRDASAPPAPANR